MSQLFDGMAWFKSNFAAPIATGTAGTPFSLDMLTAIAVQETFEVWGGIWRTVALPTILEVCVGDTLDYPSRSAKAFPKNKKDLLTDPNGAQLFAIARASLEQMGGYVPYYHKLAEVFPDKFCHAFGIFQYDIQACKTDPAYFLQRQWRDFGNCLAKCVGELKTAMRTAYGPRKATLTDTEMVYVAIAYNKGSVDTGKGFKQGYKDKSGVYYGEYMWKYLQLAHTVPG